MNIQDRLFLHKLKFIEQKSQTTKGQLLRQVKELGIDWSELNLRLQELYIIELESVILQKEILLK